MSTTTRTAPGKEVGFGEYMARTWAENGDNATMFTEWINSFMDDHVLDEALDAHTADIAVTRPELVDRTGQVVAIIRDHRRKNRQSVNYKVTPAAVSNWVHGKKEPSAEKWLSIATYLGLPLAELYDMIALSRMPLTALRLRRDLQAAAEEVDDLRGQLVAKDDDLARAERAVRLLEGSEAALLVRVEELERRVSLLSSGGCEAPPEELVDVSTGR